MAKYRKIQHEVDEAQERAELAENNLKGIRQRIK